MPTWEEQLQNASFKGVPFEVNEAGVNFGRKIEAADANGSLFVNPLANKKKGAAKAKKPSFKDNGIKVRTWSVTAHFHGDNYRVARDAFIAAVESGGAGKLVLPTYSVIQKAVAKEGTTFYSNQQLGRESITVTFVEEGEAISPKKAQATRAEVEQAQAQSLASGETNFLENFSVPSNEFSYSKITDDIQNFVDSVIEWISSGLAAGDEYDDAVAAVRAMEDQKTVLPANPTLLNNAYFDTLNKISQAFTTAESEFSALIGIAETYAGKIQEVTGTGTQALERQRNRISQLIAIQNACLANAARVLSEIQFAAVDDAQLVRQSFGTAVQSLQATLGTEGGFPETYRDLVRLNAAVYNDLIERSAALPVIQERVLLADVGAVKFSFEKYGDADRVTEILNRNDVRRSLFLAGDVELLSR